MNIHIKILIACIIIFIATLYSYSYKTSFTSMKQNIKEEAVVLQGISLQENRNRLLVLKGSNNTFEVLITTPVRLNQILDSSDHEFKIKYFDFETQRCLHSLLYKDQPILDHSENLVCSSI